MEDALFQKVSARIDGYADEMIKMETELTAIPALSPENDGEGELEKSNYIKTIISTRMA